MRRLAWFSLGLAGCQPELFAPSTEMVAMRDGVELATDVYLPDGGGAFPVILFRTPYNKTGNQWSAEGLTAAGIAVVAQDMRGHFNSEGQDGVFTTDGDGELADGHDTIAWIAEQPWSDGKIATSGESALGIVQYLAAPSAPAELVLTNAEFATPNVYSQLMFQGGVRRWSLSHNWLEDQGSLDFEDQIAAHPYLDAFWGSSETADRFADVDSAGYHVGGWYDIASQGTLDAFVGYQHEGGPGAAGHQKLVMGPWHHNGIWSTEQGELTYPDNAEVPPYDNLFDVMFNYWLEVEHGDIPERPSDIPNVQYYVMGDVDDANAPGNEWRTAEDWPPAAANVRLFLQPGGGLAEQCPPDDGGTTRYTFDPANPSPTICGANLTIDAGSCDQREVEARPDVVVFETDVLASPMEITGRVHANLLVEIDQPDADLMVRMTDVYPDGRSMLIADGALRLATRGSLTEIAPLAPGEIVQGSVDLWSTSIVVNSGHRLRISVTSSNWPRFAVNRNNGLPYPESIEGEARVVEVTLHHGADGGSYIELPDPRQAPTDVVTCD